mgnify:CR=1 FL=1
MDRRTFRFEDEEYLQHKRGHLCSNAGGGADGGAARGYDTSQEHDAFGRARSRGGPQGTLSGGGGVDVGPGAKNANAFDPSAIAKALGKTDAERQRAFNANAAMEAAEMAGNRPEGPAPKAKVEPKPKPEPTPTPVATAPAASSSPAPTYTAPTVAATPAFDMDAYMAEVDARYADQMASIQKSLDAADEARQKQIDELTQVTEDKRKKIKSSRKQGRLSLLSGSELGIPTTSTLG